MKVETRRDTPICHSKIIQYGLAQSLITEEFPRNPAASIRWSIMRVLCPYNNSGVPKGLHYSNPWFRCCLKQSQLAMWSRVSWTVGFPAFTSQVLGGTGIRHHAFVQPWGGIQGLVYAACPAASITNELHL